MPPPHALKGPGWCGLSPPLSPHLLPQTLQPHFHPRPLHLLFPLRDIGWPQTLNDLATSLRLGNISFQTLWILCSKNLLAHLFIVAPNTNHLHRTTVVPLVSHILSYSLIFACFLCLKPFLPFVLGYFTFFFQDTA